MTREEIISEGLYQLIEPTEILELFNSSLKEEFRLKYFQDEDIEGGIKKLLTDLWLFFGNSEQLEDFAYFIAKRNIIKEKFKEKHLEEIKAWAKE